jgi:hypothetical protein
MPYYVDKDGSTVKTWEIVPGGIRLEDGIVLEDGTYEDRIFVGSHPDKNPLLEKRAGVYWYKASRCMKED